MSKGNWVCIYTTEKEYLAAMVQAVLEENEIPVSVMNQKDSSYQFGEIHIYIPDEMTIKALDIIKNTLTDE